jgi:uncharacterized protein (UPF0276 family)
MTTKTLQAGSLSSPGIGLRGPHVQAILASRPALGWLEVHAENYMRSDPALRLLDRLRCHYPLSLHGVSLSLGSAGPLDRRHLRDLSTLVRRLDPHLVSEHLSWSRIGNDHFNDLLPLPYTEEALKVMSEHIDTVQCALGRTILIENPSRYLSYRHSTLSEGEFLSELTDRTECRVLLDVNNLYVSAQNVGLDVADVFAALPADCVREIHVAGHAAQWLGSTLVLIDDHGSHVSDDVWRLYAAAIARFGPQPCLVEWDNHLPPIEVLLREASRAAAIAACAQGAMNDRAA